MESGALVKAERTEERRRLEVETREVGEAKKS